MRWIRGNTPLLTTAGMVVEVWYSSEAAMTGWDKKPKIQRMCALCTTYKQIENVQSYHLFVGQEYCVTFPDITVPTLDHSVQFVQFGMIKLLDEGIRLKLVQ